MFCAPTEIDTQIRNAASLTSADQIHALDVLRWAMLETCKELEHHISHWAQQGDDYHRRADAQRDFAQSGDIDTLKGGWTSPESRSLQEMYGASGSTATFSESFTQTAFGIDNMKQRLESLGLSRLEDPNMDEEQEREVSHEVEREQQIERPPKLPPATHIVHEDVRRFVRTGFVPANPTGVVPLQSASQVPAGTWSSKLCASRDFFGNPDTSRAIQLGDYMHPLNFILSGPDSTLIALSPYEADQLLPEIRKSPSVRLHVFAPRVTQSMISFSDLRFYSVPDANISSPDIALQLQLGLFAGQLYFGDYGEYRTVCAFLGVFVAPDGDQEGIPVQSDGFVKPLDRTRLAALLPEYRDCGFSNSPISTLKELVGYRRKGMEYWRTHVGQLLHARPLLPNDF